MQNLYSQALNAVFNGTNYNLNLQEIENGFTDLGPYVISGLVPAIGTGLSVNVSAGNAMLNGDIVVGSFVLSGLTDNTTNHLYLVSTGTGLTPGTTTGQSNTTGTPPSNSVKLGTCVTAGGVVTSVQVGLTSGRQQFIEPNQIIHGGPSAGLASAGHPRSLNLNDWNATAAEGFECYGVLPGGAVPPAGRSIPITRQTVNYTILTTDWAVLMDCSGGPRTATLPTAIGLGGTWFIVKKVDNTANLLTVATTAGQTIDTAAGASTSSPQASLQLLSDNANWQTINLG